MGLFSRFNKEQGPAAEHASVLVRKKERDRHAASRSVDDGPELPLTSAIAAEKAAAPAPALPARKQPNGAVAFPEPEPAPVIGRDTAHSEDGHAAPEYTPHDEGAGPILDVKDRKRRPRSTRTADTTDDENDDMYTANPTLSVVHNIAAPSTANGYAADVKRNTTVTSARTAGTTVVDVPTRATQREGYSPEKDRLADGAATPPHRSRSIKTTTSSSPSARVTGGAFGMGAGASGPAAGPEHNASLHARAATAESVLSPEAKLKIAKEEVKDAKRISKILKSEAKSEQRLLERAIKELDKVQAVQKKAVADEARALSTHSKAVREEHKLNMTYLAAKAKWEAAAAQLRSAQEILDETKERAQAQTELLAQKTAEVDQLRAQKATDDRERQAKLLALSDPSRR